MQKETLSLRLNVLQTFWVYSFYVKNKNPTKILKYRFRRPANDSTGSKSPDISIAFLKICKKVKIAATVVGRRSANDSTCPKGELRGFFLSVKS